MKYALVFWSVAGLCAFHAATAPGLAVALWWPAISFGIAGAAYAGVGPRAFGKRDEGSLNPYAASLLFPYLIYTWGLWHLWRLATREPPYHELYEGVTIGRRLLSGELPKHLGEVFDLTAEFPEPRGIRRRVAYRCFPTLDARPPERDALRVAAEQVLSSKHPVLIHCANGHGRTGTLAGAVLLAGGRVQTAEEAVDYLQRSRPRLSLNAAQRRALEEFAELVGRERRWDSAGQM